MSGNDALFPQVQEWIDFETLLAQAKQALVEYAGKRWSHMGENDPGITLLQAICYNVSDIGYRSSLPLTDLLTPAPVSQERRAGEGIFPAAFGPQRALTCGPISEDDYRRALLDLHSTGDDSGYFYFNNAQLVREPEEERYRYWYNAERRVYSFVEPQPDLPEWPVGDEPCELTLLGNYLLYLQPTRGTLADLPKAQAALDAFLRENSNLGEAVSRVIWLQPQDMPLSAVIALRDDVDATTTPAAIMAALFTAVETYVTPPVRRYSTQQLQQQGLENEAIYDGPYLEHGWITDLPPPLDCARPITVNLARLVNAVLDIDGVQGILSMVPGEPWEWTTEPGCYPLLWGPDPIATMLESVTLVAHGIDCVFSVDEVVQYLTCSPLLRNPPVLLPYGRWRNPSVYSPATDYVPPCYGLLHLPVTPEQTQLHQFLLPFEQLLANGCQQLALLPNLLAFNREAGDTVWGEQWPFAKPGVNNEVFKDCSAAIKAYLQQCSEDMEKELSYVDYLLGYFNSSVAPRTLLAERDEFLASQQGYLANIASLTYQRANFRVDKVSALQQRIAARLGIGGEGIFNEDAPLDKLPFYVVEHRALLPVYPDHAYDALQDVKTIYQDGAYLRIELQAVNRAPLRIGQVVTLVVGEQGKAELSIRALMIAQVFASSAGTDGFSIKIADSAQLQRHLQGILDPHSTVRWQNCQVWLEDMYYPLVYDDNQHGLGPNQKRLTSSPQSPYPAMVREGDLLTIEYRISPTARSFSDSATTSLPVKVVKADSIASTLVVECREGDAFPLPEQTRKYFWYFDSAEYAARDRFSFMTSVVFCRDHIDKVASDPYVVSEWMKSVILQEYPSYISMVLQWMPLQQFENFAYTYNSWQNNGAPLGDASYSLMRMLTLGCLPSSLTGIGAMYIATEDQKEQVVGPAGDQWNADVIVENELFYVPRAEYD
ncbi:hypothetical protein [Dyella choica]|uniref:Uncharacterized protein n=1 Tax=Dyella choica TaxID=1927959 RepID=A0A432M9B5_9GAMM|nr:hypothetical protein [Dyella choica]RUL78803.1 hypothetical protein EKH80_03045 [Dyella choica]